MNVEKRLQTYEADQITVTFDPNVCQHSGVCVRTLPSVFGVRRRRWIMPELAEPGEVAAAIERCPSGALRYQLTAPPAARFVQLYAAFNARDIDTVLSQLATDVDWPNAIDGGRLHGHEAVRAYWAQQFIAVSPTVHPTNVVLDDNGKVVVTVHQVVRDLSGSVLKDQYVQHVYELRGEMIARMDIRSDIE
jgi:uncharacterized Fe-S cluster protein YjdI